MRTKIVKTLSTGALLATLVLSGAGATYAATPGTTDSGQGGHVCVVSSAPANSGAKSGLKLTTNQRTLPAGSEQVPCDTVHVPPGAPTVGIGGPPDSGVISARLSQCRGTDSAGQTTSTPTCHSFVIVTANGTAPAGATAVPCDSLPLPRVTPPNAPNPATDPALKCYRVGTPSGS